MSDGTTSNPVPDSVQVLGRALPVLLFVSLFLHRRAVAADEPARWWRLTLVVALFSAVTVLADAVRLREEISRVKQDFSPSTLTAACAGTLLAAVTIDGPVSQSALAATKSATCY